MRKIPKTGMVAPDQTMTPQASGLWASRASTTDCAASSCRHRSCVKLEDQKSFMAGRWQADGRPMAGRWPKADFPRDQFIAPNWERGIVNQVDKTLRCAFPWNQEFKTRSSEICWWFCYSLNLEKPAFKTLNLCFKFWTSKISNLNRWAKHHHAHFEPVAVRTSLQIIKSGQSDSNKSDSCRKPLLLQHQ